MNAMIPTRSRASDNAPIGRMLWKQGRAQGRLLLRQPAVGLVAILLPALLFVLFATPNIARWYSPGVSMGAYMLASLGAYGVGLTMVFSFGVTVAIDRGQRNDLLMRATPLPPAVDLASRALVAIVFAAFTLIVLFAIAFMSGVRLASLAWLWLMLMLILGSLPLLGLSFAIAYLTGANAAAAIMNMLYMILAFASGMLVPMSQLPAFVQDVARYLPTYHFAQLGWSVVGAPAEQVAVSLAWLAGYAVLFFAAALWAYRRDSSHRFH